HQGRPISIAVALPTAMAPVVMTPMAAREMVPAKVAPTPELALGTPRRHPAHAAERARQITRATPTGPHVAADIEATAKIWMTRTTTMAATPAGPELPAFMICRIRSAAYEPVNPSAVSASPSRWKARLASTTAPIAAAATAVGDQPSSRP